MTEGPPRLLAVAHGTASRAGATTLGSLRQAIASARPDVTVDLCFLDVADPRLPDVLDERPTIVVPLLLSTGYHVETDIPAAVAPFTETRVARHLGPDPVLGEVLMARLGADPNGFVPSAVALVAAGSRRPSAARDLDEVAADLHRRFRDEVPVRVVTMADDLGQAFAQLPRWSQVATYLLVEGRFVSRIADAAAHARALAHRGAVAPPLGVHPKLVELVWRRYDEAAGPGPVRSSRTAR